MSKNKHGLSRDIPADVKRSVRQSCGFGCVICGSGIVEYEHVDPEFSEAVEHDADCITLLCPQCHSKVTTGFWSKAKVAAAMKNPVCLKTGFSREVFDVGTDGLPQIRFGGMTYLNCPTPIQVAGMPLFSIEAPEEPAGPFRLSGYFTDSSENQSLAIVQNEWRAGAENWDVEVSGGTITIREGKGNINLRLATEPPSGLVVDRLEMKLAGYLFQGNGDNLTVQQPNGNIADFTQCGCDGCLVGMAF